MRAVDSNDPRSGLQGKLQRLQEEDDELDRKWNNDISG